MIIIGHRGAKGLATENSLESIKLGIESGSDMIEVDVRLQSKNLVLSHDPTLKTENYCLLSEALELINNSVPLVLEIKESEVVEFLPELIKNYNGRIIISSRKFAVLDDLRKLLPDHELAVIENWSGVRAVAEASLLSTKNIHINHNWLWSGFVRSMKHKGYTLYAYTVNDPERAEELRTWGVDGIFTDRPDKFKGGKK
jgi:glycerophosphoryl diester phosphodiesterase